MRVALLGFGLIGGSIARALRASEPPARWSMTAWSPAGDGPRAAVADGTLERAAADAGDAVAGAELVILAAPPLACLDLIDRLGGPLRDVLGDALVTDVASTKRAIVERAAVRGLRFVGGHPMAGRETTGYGSADEALFRGRPWVVVEGGAAADSDVVEALATTCGSLPVRMAAEDHDAAVAAISHLPLVVAAALVEAAAGGPGAPRADWPAASRLAAAGWRDTTRLARGDIEMGVGIGVTNAVALAARLRDLRAVLDGWLEELEADGGPDPARLEARLRGARDALERIP